MPSAAALYILGGGRKWAEIAPQRNKTKLVILFWPWITTELEERFIFLGGRHKQIYEVLEVPWPKGWSKYGYFIFMGFPDSSVGKESTCNAGDPGSIPGLGRSAGQGIGYPLQYSWVSLVAQLIKNPPAMRETWVWSLGWEDPLEEGMVTHSSILAWRIPLDRRACWATVHGVTKNWPHWATKCAHTHTHTHTHTHP